MASLKALFSVFSQTASLQFAQAGGRGDNFKASLSHFSIVRPKLANGEFVCVRSFVQKCTKVYKARNVPIIQVCSCASMGV